MNGKYAKKRRQRRLRILIVVGCTVLLAALLILLLWWMWTFVSDRIGGESAPGSSAVSSSSAVPDSSVVSALPPDASGSSSGGMTAGESSAGTVTTSKPGGSVDADGNYIQAPNPPWNLILVNDWNKAPDWCYDKSYLVKHGTGEFDERAVEALSAMVDAAKADGITDMRDLSTWRSYEVQEKNFNRKVQSYKNQGYSQAEAERLANTIIKRPGYSEHHTGLAADMGGSGDYSITDSFEKTAAFRWLKEHCAEYGFILRFPKDKEDITGVTYESWHYRYVGVEHAKIIMKEGLCLEEYLQRIGS